MKLSTKIFGSLVFAFFLTATASFLLYSPSLLAEPKITWEPKSLHNKVQLGSSSTTIVEFIPESDASNVVVNVVPELSPYVQVSPSSFSSLKKGNVYALNIKINIPSNATIEAVEGTIQLKQGKRTIAKPLPIALTISAVKASVQLGNLLVEYNLPDKWKQFNGEIPGKVSLMSPASLADIEAGSGMTPSDMVIWILPNPEEMTLSEFVDNYDAGWYKNYAVRRSTLVDGYDALVLDDNTSEIPSAPSPIAFIAVAGNIVVVSGSWPVAQMFQEFLKTVEIQ